MLNEPGAAPRRTPSVAGRFAAALLVCVLLVTGGMGVGYALGREARSSQEKADLGTFWEAWGILDKKFFGDTSVDKRVNGAIAGMVAGLGDPYTLYLEPKQDQLFRDDLQGSFGGIGAELSVKGGRLVIVAALDNTPASKAGLKANDIISEIDGKPTAEMSFVDAISAIRGEKGSTLTLVIQRGEEEPREVSLVRDTIVVESVTTDTLGAQKDIAYINVNQFGQDTATSFRAALVAAQGKKGLIIDLRNNPGGYLNASLQMIGMVLPKATASTEETLRNRVGVVEKGKKGDSTLKAGNDVVADTIPIIVLVNEGSASASEIFAGAMKDYKRATLVGVQTFGKGSVQELQDLENGGSIKVTVAKWFTPLGTGIDGEGIAPDVTVALPADTAASTDDIQVQKALELLSQ